MEIDKLPHKLIIFLTNQKKQIDNDLEHKQHFVTLNINTAVTNTIDIIVYRKQELLKSIFHELIHFNELDFRKMPPESEQQILYYLKKTHNIYENNKYLLYECVTETLANILNNIFSITQSYNNNKEQLQQFHKNFIDEITFSTFQVAKILKICKYKSWDEFALINKNNQQHNTHNNKKQFKQDSCVFSYYILKLYLLLNINEYFTTILDKQLKFNPTQDNFNKLIKIFEKGRHNKYLSTIINSILKYNTIATFKHHTKYNIIKKTLRMTCID